MVAEKQIINFKNVFDTPFSDKLRTWRNQDFVRLKMVNQDVITEEQHIKYLEKIRKDEKSKIYIAFDNAVPFGVVIFTINAEENYIEPAQYLINESFLGKGYGKIIKYAQNNYIFRIFPDGEMRTKILQHNTVTLGLNHKMGAQIRCTEKFKDENGLTREAYVLYLNASMWQEKRPMILSEIKAKHNDIIIEEIID